MYLLNGYGVLMNPKKIYRLMKKYGICSTVRKKNPNLNAYKEHNYFDNILDRKFDVDQPGIVFATDMTYLIWGSNRYYLSVVNGLGSNEVLVWKLSRGLGLDLSLDLIGQLAEKCDMKNVLIHLNKGFHYINPLFINKLKELEVTQSMSHHRNCLENAKMETFFGHFKDECKYQEAKNLE